MNNPLISVCITASNTAKYLEAALRSVGGQTYTKWEILVVQDGANERCAATVQEFAFTVSQRVSFRQSESNQDLPVMRNAGIADANGEWVAFLDADDLWKPDHLASLVSASQIEDSDLVFAGAVLYDDATWTKLGVRTPKESDLANLPAALFAGRLSILASAVMARKESLRKFGSFAKEFPHCSDTEYWLRMLSGGGHLYYSGNDTCIYRQTAAPDREQTASVLMESAQICERYATWNAIPRSLARARPSRLYRWAGRTLIQENPAAALASLSRALRLQPLNPKTLGLWIRVFLRKLRGGAQAQPKQLPDYKTNAHH
jgi:glycosyltransferase involved in cell wall biosynthesis